MTDVTAKAHAQRISIEATVIRADGRVEPLGVVSYYHRNPLKRLVWRLTRKAL